MSKSYFSKLNYTLANEDTSLEYGMVKALKPANVLAVCGSGGRSLPLLAGTMESLTCGDLSQQQLWLAQHRAETFIKFNWKEFLLYWGFPPFDSRENHRIRREMFHSLELSAEAKDYFQKVYESIEFQSLLYEGKWEKTFTGVPRLLRRIVGNRYDEIFSFQNMEEQKKYFDKELQHTRWVLIPRLVLRAFGNAAFFNTFLYKGHFAEKNIEDSHFEIYRKAYSSLFYQGLTRKNFFLQLTFLGHLYYTEGNPIEAHKQVFEEIKTKLKTVKVNYVLEDLISHGESSSRKYDFVSLSDVPSYFSGDHEKNYLQRLSKGLNPGALVVVRCYLRIPEGTDMTGFKEVTGDYRELIAEERTQIYTTFIYRYEGKP